MRGYDIRFVLAALAVFGSACGTELPPAATSQSAAGGRIAPTWYRDVLPVVQVRCQGCHVNGGIAPFPLTTYDEAAARHASMAQMVETRQMPPWMPAETCLPLRDSRRLTTAEVDTIVAWALAGAPAGDPTEAPPPAAPRAGLPWVDATLDAGADYTPAAWPGTAGGGADDYRCFMLDPGLAQDRDLIGFDIEPGVRRMVHHVLLFAGSAADVRAADDSEAGLGWRCFGGPGIAGLPAVVGGWAPGSAATSAPAGTGLTLAAGSALVMQVHYNLDNGPPAPDRTVVKLQYSAERVAKPAQVLPLADLFFAIPPGARGYTTRVSLTFPRPATLWGVAPHMHTLGRQIKVEKDGACIVDIPSWQFHWQQAYFLSDPAGLALPAGSRLTLTCTWDNPTGRTVTWGEGTSDEMCLSYLYLTF